jgi:hypothetical protein
VIVVGAAVNTVGAAAVEVGDPVVIEGAAAAVDLDRAVERLRRARRHCSSSRS